MKLDGQLCFKKYIPSAKTLYIEDLSNITFNYLCQNSLNSFCHSWNHKSFFTTQFLYIFLAQTLHTFEKSSPKKCKFSDFLLLVLKFTKFLMLFSNKKSVFVQSLDHSSVSWEITLLYYFSWNFIWYWQKETIKVQLFRLLTAPMKINQIPLFCKPPVSFSLNIASPFNIMTHNTPAVF